MQLSVIIVNYNVCYFLEQCLCSVLRAAGGISTEIIVVDNASQDESRKFLPDRFPEVRFIWNENNAGFGRANNQALQIAKGDYLLLLNPDTLLPENVLKVCLNFFASHPDAGALGMRMFDGRGHYLPESKRGLPDAWTAFFKLSGLIRLFPRHPRIARYYLGHLSPEEVQEVEVLAGAFMMLPRSVYEKLGGFDEAFFMYGEDIDLSYRITKAGYKNYYLPSPGIIHFKGESTRKDIRYTRHFYEAMLIFVRKHYGKQPVFQKLAMELGIFLRGSLSGFGKLIKKKEPEVITATNWRKTGAKAVLAELASIPGPMQVAEGGMIPSANRPDIETAPDLTKGEPTIFAIGEDFGLNLVLNNLRQYHPAVPVRFHIAGTASVAGSDDPGGRGEVILL